MVLDTLRLDALPAEPPTRRVAPRNLAYVLFTSGSTGRPKGIQVEHQTVINCLHWTRRAMRLAPGHHTSHLAGQSFGNRIGYAEYDSGGQIEPDPAQRFVHMSTQRSRFPRTERER